MKEKFEKFIEKSSKAQIFTMGALVGIILFAIFRYATFSPETTHFHANFAVHLNGQREDFEAFTYYEEVTACSAEVGQSPKERVHMHQPDNDVVHIHDTAVTWGHFFENLSYSIGEKFISTGTEVLVENDTNKVIFVLNDEIVRNPNANEIGDEDTLLVYYGNLSDDEVISLASETITSNAAQYNESSDPGTCSSKEGLSAWDRFKETVL